MPINNADRLIEMLRYAVSVSLSTAQPVYLFASSDGTWLSSACPPADDPFLKVSGELVEPGCNFCDGQREARERQKQRRGQKKAQGGS